MCFMGVFDRIRKKRIEGMIGYLGLEDFWISLSFEQSESMKRYAKSGLGGDSCDSPIEGKISYTSARPLPYLGSFIGWAVSDHDYDLADKIIEHCDKIYEKATPVDKHFYLMGAADCYYKQRTFRDNALNLAEKYHMMDVKLFPQYKNLLVKDMGGILPRIPSFQQLVIMYEKAARYQEAIAICKLAMKYGLTDSTKRGYAGRLEKLQKKLEGFLKEK